MAFFFPSHPLHASDPELLTELLKDADNQRWEGHTCESIPVIDPVLIIATSLS